MVHVPTSAYSMHSSLLFLEVCKVRSSFIPVDCGISNTISDQKSVLSMLSLENSVITK